MTVSRLLVGLIGMPLGFVILYFRVGIKDFMGNVSWAEKYLGQGGTWTAIVFLGLGTSVFSFLWMLGVFQAWFIDTFGVFFGTVS